VPVRELRPAIEVDGDPLIALRQVIAEMTPQQLARFALTLSPDDLALLEQAQSDVAAGTWRDHPAAMREHLTQGEYKRWAYIELLSKAFAAGIRGEDPRQLWNLPSQYGKTTLLLETGVPWALDFNPRLRIMYVTYDADKAVEEGGKARDFARDHADVLRFTLRDDRRARGMWATTQGGGLYCVGIHGGIVGWPADVVICDDLLKGWEVAHSETQRNAVWSIYLSQIRFRVQGPRCPIFIVGTRWHEDDPTGKALKAEVDPAGVDRWRLIRLPAIAEEANPDSPDIALRDPDPLGREPGEVLEAERFPPEEVHARAIVAGSYLAAALEQQRPAPEEGNDIKRSWWRVEVDGLPAQFDDALTSWDMKLKDKEAGDFVVGQLHGRVASHYWIVDQLRGQWNQATAKAAISLMAVRHPWCKRHVIENTGYGPEVIEQLRAGAGKDYVLDEEIIGLLGILEHEVEPVTEMLRAGLPGIVPNNPKGDKRVRARAMTPIVESGNYHLWSQGTSFVPIFLEEVSAFPNGSHDDQVDAWSQGASRLSKGSAMFSTPSGSVRTTRTQATTRVPRAARRYQ
jgi:phage terminase large subunit-like protein